MVRIETAARDDVPALVGLLSRLFAIEKDFAFESGRQQRGLERLVCAQPDRAIVCVARSETRGVVGMASGQIVISTAEGAGSVWIEDVFVDTGFRGRGIGSALIDSVIEWAIANGATRAQLLADQDNREALGFYQRHGWQRSSMLLLRLPLKRRA